MAVFSVNIKGPVFGFICFPIPLPWWHKKSQRQFVTARACTRVCVHALTPANALVTRWCPTINSLFKMWPHRGIQKVIMIDSELHREDPASIGGGGAAVSVRQQEATWTECQHLRLSKVTLGNTQVSPLHCYTRAHQHALQTLLIPLLCLSTVSHEHTHTLWPVNTHSSLAFCLPEH